jgi:hypothetical protein
LGIVEKHHPKTAGGEIESLAVKWQMVRIGRLSHEVQELFVAGALGRDVEQLRTLVDCYDRTLRTNALRKTDSGLARAAGQIERAHPRQGA